MTNLLELSRLQSGQGNLRRSALPAAEILRSVIERARGQSRAPSGGRYGGEAQAQRRFLFSGPREELIVEADAALFDLVLTNVIQNAMRYSHEGSGIEVVCRAEDADCVIEITDEGSAIVPPEASTKARAMARPSPEPGGAPARRTR